MIRFACWLRSQISGSNYGHTGPVCMYACMYVCMYACLYVCMYVCMNTDIQEAVLTKFESQMLTSAAVPWKKYPQFSKLHYFLYTSFSEIILDDMCAVLCCALDQILVLTNLIDPIFTEVPARAVTVLVQSRV